MIKRLILVPAVTALTVLCQFAPAAAAPVYPPLTTAEIKAALLTTANLGSGYKAKRARTSLTIPVKSGFSDAACNKALKAYDTITKGRPTTTVNFLDDAHFSALGQSILTGTPARLNAVANGAKAIALSCHGRSPADASVGTAITRKSAPKLGDSTIAFRMTGIPEFEGVTYHGIFIRYRSALVVIQHVSKDDGGDWPLTLATAKKAAAKLKAVYAKRG
ncbi:hypothetical protein [Acrocarpospora catenulata]|uniref:hypothetical protein n=1 Tax=Acrocarpospora catenulata TaxID=2836182 RepID=UPI001BD9A026|nr:hypothetical protein [Acrocarpospora catenulata]